MFNLVILIVVDVISEVLFYCLVELFYLFICLGVKSYRTFVVYSKFYNESYKELKGKDRASIYYKLV